ncbi:MAG: hypothetical protein HWQ35_04295 [Nostoc sp. NMS1]|uniref:M12 family metallopeptidase n=1 Tax=unclassified Nostoc TaxID=2593658 RepID=UPI0025FFBB78|nr:MULTISPECIES: tachylectin-related carbohydrate-binding protein [unclassified Nostoc]MBN3905817.1 hypothetical protein [Nostoc sp. NMS1]MBN3991365.1 hypothetical protein [Nostoc sp. NMS2]
MADEIKVCSVPVLSDSGQASDEFSLVGVSAFFWENGRTLQVRFLDGVPEVQSKVEQIAHQWSQFANIKFAFGSDPHAEIRISFQREGSWSKLGRSALEVTDPNEPTMNFGWLRSDTPDDEYSRVVLHEFGHALGFAHEHKHPEAGIKWNRTAVIDYYRQTQGWDEEKTVRNVLHAESKDATQFSKFDRDSIMLYAIPSQLTTDGFSVGWNTELSETDKQFVSEIYPFDSDRSSHLAATGVIYAVKPDGTLEWYRHKGWQDGSNDWAVDVKVIGSGWNSYTQIFSGGI